MYSQVAKLFESQEDLLQEFGHFLPDATNHQNTVAVFLVLLIPKHFHTQVCDLKQIILLQNAIDQAKKSVKMNRADFVTFQTKASPNMAQKRPSLQPSGQERKKMKDSATFHYWKDISLVEAGRYGTLNEFAFFDKVTIISFISSAFTEIPF